MGAASSLNYSMYSEMPQSSQEETTTCTRPVINPSTIKDCSMLKAVNEQINAYNACLQEEYYNKKVGAFRIYKQKADSFDQDVNADQQVVIDKYKSGCIMDHVKYNGQIALDGVRYNCTDEKPIYSDDPNLPEGFTQDQKQTKCCNKYSNTYPYCLEHFQLNSTTSDVFKVKNYGSPILNRPNMGTLGGKGLIKGNENWDHINSMVKRVNPQCYPLVGSGYGVHSPHYVYNPIQQGLSKYDPMSKPVYSYDSSTASNDYKNFGYKSGPKMANRVSDLFISSNTLEPIDANPNPEWWKRYVTGKMQKDGLSRDDAQCYAHN